MIKKLQRKFIMIAGLAVVVMMVCFLLPVNLINRYRVGSELRKTIRFILDSGGSISDVAQTEDDGERMPDVLSLLTGRNAELNLTPESRYQLRFFIVTLDSDGSVKEMSLSHIAAVDGDEAAAMAHQAEERIASHGFLHSSMNSYYYLRDKTGNDREQIGFLECTREVNSLRVFYYSSMGFSLILIVIYLLIIAILSKRAMKPYIDNIESQREFITNAGHEMKTPLAIISANTEVIEMIHGKSEWTDSILTQVKRGTSLINDLITLSRAEEAEQIVLTDIDMSKTVRESSESFRPLLEKDGKKLVIQVQDDIHVKAESKMLTELCNILVDNAAKYCDDGGTVRVELKKRGRSGAQLQVSNDYRDGSSKDYSRFFHRFYRGDQSHNSKKSGYGIGLSMAQTITGKLKGNITAHWKDGVITFTVTL